MEMEHIQYIARSLIENAASWPTDNFMTASHSGHVGPMFRILWSPCLASFSIGLQNSENRDIVQLCLKGIHTSIFISGIFSHYIERDAFLQALIHFTSINPSSPSSTFKYKNVKCIQSLIDTAFESGNYLLSSWTKVLRCLSQIELEYMQSSGESPDSTRNHNLSEYVISNGSHQNFIVAVDRIFANSVNFNGDSIVEFVKALCSVSAEELKRSPPRTYCLQKILEISYYNMDRVRLQWSRTWSFVADHLINACSSNNLEVVTFALDSLRQLSLKFLEKEELTNFHFQEDFLRPFASIMRNNSFVAIRDMIIRCVLQMINAQAGNIRSGWKNLITVILIGASDPKKDIANLAFQCICRICEDLLEIYFNNMVDALQDCIKCLAEFASCAESPDVATNSLYLISHIADHLSRHHDIFNDKYDEEAIGVAIEDRIWVKGWLPIVFECSSIINRCRSNIRNQTISTLFDILNKYGNEFKLCWWDDAFSVIFRFFERSPEAGEGSNVEWSTTACMQVLHCLTDLYCSDNFDILRDMLLRKLCPLIMRILKSGHIELSRAAMRCLEKLAFTCCDKFNDDEWKVLLSSICSILGSLDQTKNMANGFNKEVVNTNRCNSSYAQSAATDSILRDELINCIIGIFRNKSVLESRIQFIRQNTKDINQLLGYKTLDYMSTKVFQYAPKNLVIPVLESFGKCLEDNCGQLNNGDISRCVTAAWLELEISRNSDTFVEDCTLSYLRRTLAILMKSESNDLFIARDRAYIEIAVILLEIYFIQDENTFIELVKRIKEDLCWSISAVAEYHYRFILAQIFLRL
ncbi:hypothetical protein GJ496_001401 [Pomphorhynchus laevis]|nr:hypothetical protein GJ496_001401 [Pomphorhynchus laevis]